MSVITVLGCCYRYASSHLTNQGKNQDVVVSQNKTFAQPEFDTVGSETFGPRPCPVRRVIFLGDGRVAIIAQVGDTPLEIARCHRTTTEDVTINNDIVSREITAGKIIKLSIY